MLPPKDYVGTRCDRFIAILEHKLDLTRHQMKSSEKNTNKGYN